jgi:hypothetical protein
VAQVGGEGPGEDELGVGGEDQGGPPVCLGRVHQGGAVPAELLFVCDHQIVSSTGWLAEIETAYKNLAARLTQVGYIASGSVQSRLTRCANPNCRCNQDPPRRHGPYWQWTTKKHGKTISRRLTAEERPGGPTHGQGVGEGGRGADLWRGVTGLGSLCTSGLTVRAGAVVLCLVTALEPCWRVHSRCPNCPNPNLGAAGGGRGTDPRSGGDRRTDPRPGGPTHGQGVGEGSRGADLWRGVTGLGSLCTSGPAVRVGAVVLCLVTALEPCWRVYWTCPNCPNPNLEAGEGGRGVDLWPGVTGLGAAAPDSCPNPGKTGGRAGACGAA